MMPPLADLQAEPATAPRPESPTYALMGPLEVRIGRRDRTPRPYKLRVILAALLVQANRTISVDTLIEAVWGDRPPRTALQALRVYVSQLRRILDDCPHANLLTRSPGYHLQVPPLLLDTHRFSKLRSQGLAAEREGDLDRARRLYNSALTLQRGAALADVTSSQFLRSTALRLDEMWMTTLQRRIDIDLRTLDTPDIVAELRWLCSSHPLDEALHTRLMIGLAKAGRTKEALDVHAAFREAFVEQLGIEPHRMLDHVQRAILSADHNPLDELRTLETL